MGTTNNGRHSVIMSREKEPEELASIAVSRDEVAARTRPQANKPRPSPSGGNQKLLWAVILFVLALAVGLFVQLQQVKAQSDKQLQAISALQQRLVSTDEQANLSVDALKVILKEQDHEIRKLWDVSNKRNKRDINKNAERISAQEKQVTAHDKRLSNLNSEIEQNQKAAKALIKQNKADIDKQLASVNKQMAEINKQVDQAISSLPNDLAGTLDRHGKGIKAMDETRLRLLKRINVLESELKTLSAKVNAGQTTAAP